MKLLSLELVYFENRTDLIDLVDSITQWIGLHKDKSAIPKTYQIALAEAGLNGFFKIEILNRCDCYPINHNN